MNKSLKYSLAGAIAVASLAAFSAWGAESVYTLIANGEQVISQMKQAKSQHQQLKEKSANLGAMMDSIKDTQPQLQQAVQQHNAASKQLQSDMAAYKKNCSGKSLPPDKYKKCEAQQKQLNAQINQVNAGTKSLQAKQKALKAKIAQYNAESQALNAAAPKNADAINNAFAAEQEWLDNARNVVASPAFAPYRKSAGCPEVKKPPSNASELQHMAGELLSCLRNLAHHSKAAAPAAGT